MMIILILIAGILAGMAIPVQTSINSRLGMKIGSPYGAAAISFFVGTLLLLIVALVTERHFLSIIGLVPSIPWWILIGGGCLGVFYLTSNILLLPRLGSGSDGCRHSAWADDHGSGDRSLRMVSRTRS